METELKFSKGFKSVRSALTFRDLVMADEPFQAREYLRANCAGLLPVGWDALCISVEDRKMIDDWIFHTQHEVDYRLDDGELEHVCKVSARRDVPLSENADLGEGYSELSYFLRDILVEERPMKDYLLDEKEYDRVHAGLGMLQEQVTTGALTTIKTGRDLATYVHSDNPFRAWGNVVEDLIDLGVPVDLPGGGDFAKRVFLNGLIGEVIGRAWVAAFYLKYKYMFIRPEELARARGGLLPIAYAEGCPLHSSRPSGHSFIASALEAAFLAVVGYSFEMPTGKSLGEELALKRSNVEVGRIYGGVHFEDDNTVARPLAYRLGRQIAMNRLG